MSPLLAPDLAEIERALDRLLQGDRSARVLAMRSPLRRGWPEEVHRDGRRFRVVWCPSELELREQLDGAEGGGKGLVVLTPLDEATLGDDVVARFHRARLSQTDRWSALRGAFRARDVDPRLRLPTNSWLVDLLLERSPIRGYAPAPGGFLDLEGAWRAAAADVLGLPDGRADTATLLERSLDPAGLTRLARLPEEARESVAARLGAEGGAATVLVLTIVLAGRGADALAIALACGVVFGEAEPHTVLREAAIRLEPTFGGKRVDPSAGRALAEAGRRVLDHVARDAPAVARAVEARAVSILEEVRAESAVALSPALFSGLEARMKEAAAALQRAVEAGQADAVVVAWDLVQHAAAHDRASEGRARLERLRMAARLARWLFGSQAPAWRSLSEAASAYAAHGGFVDRARRAVRAGDALPEVSAAYARLAEVASTRREEENRAFAEVLREWTAGGASGDDPLPVEDVLAKVVAPLAREIPVLLLVLDGLSLAVWRELSETTAGLGWSELVPASRRSPLVAAAVLPSVTEVSRTSLLCGAVRRGDQGVERAGFAIHPDLVAASRASRPPRLFHKADLGSGPELGSEVRAAVSDSGQRVVGVVHNAVDAQLSGSDQLDLTWTADGLRQVSALLQAARDAGRVVVVTGDHGHVLEEASVLMTGGSGDRWRADGTLLREGEMAFSGRRVLSPAGGVTVVAAWSERVRFASKKGGYHGGTSPQEVLVPVAVLAAGQPPAGWSEAPPVEPAWWRGRAEDASPMRAALGELSAAPRRRQIESRQAELFSGPARPSAPLAVPGARWLDAMLASEAYATQRRLAGRSAPADDLLRGMLEALVARGGRMTRAGLAQAVGVPGLRLSGLVSAARRVLNLDQAQVLRDEGDDVVLDEGLLRAQFGVGGGR